VGGEPVAGRELAPGSADVGGPAGFGAGSWIGSANSVSLGVGSARRCDQVDVDLST
jgi:hypothetical protein